MFKSFNLAKEELKDFWKSRFTRLSIFVVALVPLLYGVLYLWAFWDPYTNMKDVPIAIVNNDQPITKDSTTYSLGNQIVDKLKANQNFKWEFVSQADADKGLTDKKYYAELIIPNDFSQNITSVDSNDSKPGILQFKARKATNLLAAQISNSAAYQISQTIGNDISKNYFDNIFLQTQNSAQDIQKAANGSSQLTEGLQSAKDGSTKLSEATLSAYRGSESLVSGINDILLGDNSLHDGIVLSYSGAKQLDDGIGQSANGAKSLVSGSAQVKSGITAVSGGVNQLLNNTSSTTAALQTAKQFLTVAQSDPTATISASDPTNPLHAYDGLTYTQAANAIISTIVSTSTSSTSQQQIAALQSGLSTLSTGDNQLDQGINNLSLALNDQVKPGSNQLVNGLSQLKSGSLILNLGLLSAKSGSTELSTGLSQISSGSTDLSSGIATAETGAATLSQQLSDGAKKALLESDSKKTEQMSPVMSDPVKLSDVSIDNVPNYGTGFAPYFIPLALWVGSLIIFLIIKTNETAFEGKMTKYQVTFSKYLLSIGIGTLQAIIMDTVLIKALHIAPVHPVGLYLFSILASWCFIAILQFCVSLLGDAGKFIGIVLLMLQLTSAAGTFPIETAPKFFQLINPYLPMTYVVSCLREIISGDNWKIINSCSAILAICGLVFILLTLVFNKHVYRVDKENITNENELAGAVEI